MHPDPTIIHHSGAGTSGAENKLLCALLDLKFRAWTQPIPCAEQLGKNYPPKFV
jgi:hypothetical protein